MTSRTASNVMPFLCDLGWHRPRPMARWNEGFYFTNCARCGCDLVRTAYGSWGVPRGYRVVWQASPPPNAVSAALVRERAGAPELPIQEVLRHLHHGDPEPGPEEGPENGGVAPEGPAETEADGDAGEPLAGEADVETVEAAEESAPPEEETVRLKTFPASRIPDFMDGPTPAGNWEAEARTYLVRAAPAVATAGGAPWEGAPEADEGPSWLDRLRSLLALLFVPEQAPDEEPPAEATAAAPADAPADVAADAPTDAPADPEAEESVETLGARRVLLTAIPIVMALFALIIWAVASDSPPAPPVATEMPRPEPVTGEGVPAFVTASILNCRAAPARQSRSVVVLSRGDEVLLLARDGDWVSLVRDGRQCWALMRYFSAARPG